MTSGRLQERGLGLSINGVITIFKCFHLRFRSFPTMESAVADPLENMKKDVWRFLCEKWSDKDYKVRCRKNKLN
ncbi:unnamed protein product [Camellia sinensis]